MRFFTNTILDTPSTEVTGLDCRIPLTKLSLHVLAFSARVSVLNLGTVSQFLCTIFSLALGINGSHQISSFTSYHYDP